jgi:hypothetical protein
MIIIITVFASLSIVRVHITIYTLHYTPNYFLVYNTIRARASFKRITLTPKNMTAADYDLEIGITSTIDILQEKNFAIKVQHVKGHQDKETTPDKLPKAQRMNVEADKEATLAKISHTFAKEYDDIPQAKVMLYKQNKPVTSKIPQTLRQAYLSQGLREYMIHREKWTQSTPEQICWTAHQRAIKRMNPTDKTRILKFIHRCLPTNKKLHDIDKEYSAKCPACTSTETNEHVTTCNNPRRKELRHKLWKNLSKKMEKCYTHHTVKECILTGLKKTMTGDTTILNPHELSFTPTGSVQRAITAQNKMGWNNFYRGRIALEWLTAQQEQYEGKYKPKQDTEQWATNIINTIWHGFLTLWESRKEDQHGRDLIQQKEKEREILLRRTRKLYEKIEQYDEQDKRYFKEPIEHWEQATNKNIQEWLVMAEKLAEKSKERATIKTHWFGVKDIFFHGPACPRVLSRTP